MMKFEKPYGNKILVKKLYEKDSPLENVGRFKGIVELVDFGDDFENKCNLKVGLNLRISEGSGVDIGSDMLLIVEHHILTIL